MTHKILRVEEGSIAQELGLEPGDELVSINDQPIVDFVDYQALCAQEELSLLIRRGREETIYELEKDEWEPLGLEFGGNMLGKIRLCANRCRFCFVDQLPKDARPSMRVKDDDWRTSLLFGSYVTLTNVTEKEFERILARRASPLYISVHATDDAVRNYLLRSRRKIDLMGRLKRLSDEGLSYHTQAVVCPGINDGEILERTIDDLAGLQPGCLSLAVVPVGLTGHREGLDPLSPFDRDSACRLLDMTDRKREQLLKRIGTRFVFPSDEMYIIAGRDFPSDEEYEDYAQIDNGVGMCRLLETEFEAAYELLPPKMRKPLPGKRLLIACGVSVQPFMEQLINSHPVSGTSISVRAVTNGYFGSSVTVSGLVTGGDLANQLQGEKPDAILITSTMLKEGGDCFLDGTRLCDIEEQLGVPLIPVGRTGDELLEAIMQAAGAEQEKP